MEELRADVVKIKDDIILLKKGQQDLNDTFDIWLEKYFQPLSKLIETVTKNQESHAKEDERNHADTFKILNEIGDNITKFKRVLFGEHEIDYTGIIKKQAELDEKLEEQDKKIEAQNEKIALQTAEIYKIGQRVKWTSWFVYTVFAGAIIFAAWASDKLIQIYEFLHTK